VWDKPEEVTGLDPATSTASATWQILDLVYQTLVGIQGTKIVPQLATSWSQPTPTSYVFNLRSGVHFSNGRAMTAADVVGSLERVLSAKTASWWAVQLGHVKSVRAVGPNRVEVRLASPQPTFLAGLAGISAAILPMKELAAGTFNPAKALLGTGPYEVTQHVQDRSWTLARNPHYWQASLPHFNQLSVRIVGDASTEVADLRDGNADIATFDSDAAPQLLKGISNVRTVVQPGTDFWALELNAKSSLFTNPLLRQAVALSLDRTQIADTALSGVSTPAPPTGVGLNGSCSTNGLTNFNPNIAQARALVKQAGAEGRTLTLIASPSVQNIPEIGQVVRQQIEATGLKVTILPLGSVEWSDRVYDGKADFDADISWYDGYGDPGMALYLWNPAVAVFDKPWLQTDPTLTRLISQELTMPGGASRDSVLFSACQRIMSDANIIPLDDLPNIIAYRTDHLNATFASIEGYDNPLRNIVTFTS
jgi:peptide/nickel transport system substrate-binding protein